MTPVSSLPVVLNGKVILHCKHIKVWNPTQPSPARPAAVSLSLPRGPQIAFAATAQAELSQISTLASFCSVCFCHTRPDNTLNHTHRRDGTQTWATHTPVDACELTVANGNSVADAEPAGKRKPNTYDTRCHLWGDIDCFLRDACFISFLEKCKPAKPRNSLYMASIVMVVDYYSCLDQIYFCCWSTTIIIKSSWDTLDWIWFSWWLKHLLL